MKRLTLILLAAVLSAAAQPPAQPAAPETVRKGQQLMREGKLEDALTLFRQHINDDPKSLPALNAAGIALDLMGKTKEARAYFAKAIDAAPTPQARASAQRAMAMSYAFDGDCANTVKYETLVHDYWAGQKNFYQQGEMLNEAARVCIEAGQFDTAEKLYRAGTEAGLQEPGIAPARTALWNFRLEHALGRLAARRGQKDAAAKHVAAAKSILEASPEMAKTQAPFFPYLAGYVALYTGDPYNAYHHLAQANQNDPFIQCLMGVAQEQLGQKQRAVEFYRQAFATTGHNPPAAFAKPFARAKLAQK